VILGRDGWYFERPRRSNRYFIAEAWLQDMGRQARSEATSLVSGEEVNSNEPLKML
jgi:hypothetical protein